MPHLDGGMILTSYGDPLQLMCLTLFWGCMMCTVVDDNDCQSIYKISRSMRVNDSCCYSTVPITVTQIV